MKKRLFDVALSLATLVVAFPVISIVALLVFLEDRKSPLYIAKRVGLEGTGFKMIKLRSMTINSTLINSTSKNDPRITRIGHLIRRFKIDELSQFINVLNGSMSIVGPRPNVSDEVKLYTEVERRMLSVRPGITDLASIIFSDESDILAESSDPNLDYNRLIRPWKSRLALFSISQSSLQFDTWIIMLTALNSFSRTLTLRLISAYLRNTSSEPALADVALRVSSLTPYPPPGSDLIVDKAY